MTAGWRLAFGVGLVGLLCACSTDRASVPGWDGGNGEGDCIGATCGRDTAAPGDVPPGDDGRPNDVPNLPDPGPGGPDDGPGLPDDGPGIPDPGPRDPDDGPRIEIPEVDVPVCDPLGNTSGGPTWLFDDGCPVVLDAPVARRAGPEDWRDEVIYFVMTDRFKDGDADNNERRNKDDGTPLHNPASMTRYHGGDLAGLASEADYLRKLGVTALWVTPIVENAREDDGRTGYAGYWAHDFTKVDPHLIPADAANDRAAGVAFYRDVVDELHAHGLLVIQDIVVNHLANLALYRINNAEVWDPACNPSGYGAAAHLFVDESSHQDAPWVEIGMRTKPPAPFDDPAFYHNSGRGETGTKCDVYGLDDLATERPEVQDALIAVYADWIRDAGIDGFRMDTVVNVEPEFWDAFAPAMREAVAAAVPGKAFFQFGEAYNIAHAASGPYVQAPRLDALLNFEFYGKAKSVFIAGLETNRLTAELNGRAALRAGPIDGGAGHGAAALAVNFLDSHDVMRILDEDRANVHKVRAALMYLFTAPGVPCLYYNTENETRGMQKSGEGGRVDMPDFETSGKLTFTLIRKFAALRRDNVALRRGDTTVLADRAGSGLFAFVRHTGERAEDVIALFNTSAEPIAETVDLQAFASAGDVFVDLVQAAFGQSATFPAEGSSVTVDIEPHSVRLLKRP